MSDDMDRNKYIYVRSASGQSLMPTQRKGHVRRLLNAGKARIADHVPFTIQLMYDTADRSQDLLGSTDPGRTNIGEAVINTRGEVVYKAHLTTDNKDVADHMSERKKHRNASRRGNRMSRKRLGRRYGTTFKGMMRRILPGCRKPVCLKYMINSEARFNNRKRPAGWITPSVRQLMLAHINMVKKICSILPVTGWTLEINKFAFMKMDDGSVRGVDFQNGRLKNYGSVKDYIYAMQNGRCACCERPIEHIHHIVPRSKGGADVPENLIGLCKDCHAKVHTGGLEEEIKKQGLKKKYGALSVLNQAIPYIYEELVKIFGSDNVHGCYGFQTQEYRETHNIGKDHPEDAVCIAAVGNAVPDVHDDLTAYEVMQFRRHDRQIVRYQRERTYKVNGNVVAKNRSKRCGQDKVPSFAEYGKTHKHEIGLFRKRRPKEDKPVYEVIPSKRGYNNLGRLMPGAIVLYQGKRYVVKGKRNNRQTLIGLAGNGVALSKLTVLRKNTGLVYL